MSYEPEDIEEAVRIAYRNARELGTWDCDWWDYAPPEWRYRVRNAPSELRRKVWRDLLANDQAMLEDRSRCKFLIALQVEAMHLSDEAAETLTAWAEQFPEWSTAQQALAIYRKECSA